MSKNLNHKLNFDLLEDWFEACTNLNDEVDQKFKTILNNDDLIKLIYQILDDSTYHEQYLEEICKHLFKLYLSKNENFQIFVFSFVPSLIGINLINSLDSKMKIKYNFIDVFLIGIYNFSLIDNDGTIKERSFRLPNLNKSSIYHSPEVNSNLSDIEIRKLEQCYKENRIVYVQDNVDLHYLNATNRMVVYCNLIQIYYDSISLVNKQSLFAFCRMCNSILFYNNNSKIKLTVDSNDLEKPIDYLNLLKRCKPKPQFTSNFFLQLLNCLYFCIYNGVEKEGRNCILEIHNRAKSSLYTDVLLMTNAVLNSLTISRIQNDECMGINISLSPNSEINSGQTKKSAITNASFKTQKLPDDIDIVLVKNETQEDLNIINEENDDQNHEKSFTNQQTNQLMNKSSIKDNLNSFTSSKHVNKENKKDKKKKRTKSSSNQDDINVQIMNTNESDNNRTILFKMNSQTKSNSNNDFLLESMRLLDPNESRKTANNSADLNDEKMPLM